jgi:hypothetical protein
MSLKEMQRLIRWARIRMRKLMARKFGEDKVST